ncbi:MAG TPA: hypothetical protein VHE35_13775, partial [Kofleriaceae bacterium]|nr:hypothetical protein [Kofleriaceae bacterium]
WADGGPPAAAPRVAPDDDAPPPRPDGRAVAQAREANFEPTSVREGFAIGASLGPSMQLGFSIDESSGTGGGFGVRLGTVGSPRWVWLLELAATVYRRTNDQGQVRLNQSALLTFGGQLYLRDATWVRGGVGFANFTRRTERTSADDSFSGVGFTAAAGYDLYRDGGLAWSLEVLGLGARYRAGTVLGGSLQVGLSWY